MTEADCDLFSSFLLDAALNAAMREVERVDVLGAGAGRDEAVRAALLEQWIAGEQEITVTFPAPGTRDCRAPGEVEP
ncbi:MAG: hypothetical protein OXU64_02745 [Gemmatimonadota bacterium]|nr:hypothetical protein [Gemmatimonadota bacterium]